MGAELSQLLQVGPPYLKRLGLPAPCSWRRPVRPTTGPGGGVPRHLRARHRSVHCAARWVDRWTVMGHPSRHGARPALLGRRYLTSWHRAGAFWAGVLWQPLAALLGAVQPRTAQGVSALVDCGLFTGLASRGAGFCLGGWLRVTHPFAMCVIDALADGAKHLLGPLAAGKRTRTRTRDDWP